MANGPLSRVVSGARDLRSFREEGTAIRERAELAPLRRRAAETSVRGQELGVESQEAQNQEFVTRVQRSDMARAAAEFLQIPEGDTARQDEFIRNRVADLDSKGIDSSDTAGMLDLDPQTRRQAAEATLQIAQQFGDVARSTRQPTDPSAVQEFRFFQGLTDQEKETFINIKRAQPGSTLVEIEGQKGAFNRGSGEFTPLSTAAGEREAAAEAVAATATAKGEAETELKRAETAPQRAEKARTVIASIDGVFDTVNEAIGLTGFGTTGFAALLDFIPTSDARQLGNLVGTIQANIGFDKLQSMRDSSPTGGALGQVSERELAFLQSTIANLDRKAKPEQLKKQLNKILTHYQNWRGAVINARGRDLMRDGLDEDQALEQVRTEFPQ